MYQNEFINEAYEKAMRSVFCWKVRGKTFYSHFDANMYCKMHNIKDEIKRCRLT